MGYGCCIRIWGEMALFTRPECKAERVSYNVITPSAARGIIEAVFWHPGMRYVIDKITVLKPVRFDAVRRNEVGAKATLGAISRAGKHGGPLYLSAPDERQQRASVILRDVEYLVDFHFELMPDRLGKNDDEKKFYNILLRRLRQGQHHAQPCLGAREFPAYVSLVEPGEERPESAYKGVAEHDLGFMLYDIDYDRDCTPLFFHAVMRDGEIVPEVRR